MDKNYLIFIIIAGIAIVVNFIPRRTTPAKRTYQYNQKPYVMTKTEAEFYRQIILILGNEYKVFPQIRLSALLDHKVTGQNWKGALSSINQKSVDYVVCDAISLRTLFAIELDDSTHSRPDRQERDNSVEQALATGQVRLIRFRTDTSSVEIRQTLRKAISS